MKRFTRAVLVISLLCIMGYSGVEIFRHLYQYKVADDAYSSLMEEVTETIEETAPVEEEKAPEIDPAFVNGYEYDGLTPSITVDYDALKEKNEDYIGWLHIEGLGISYPVTYREGDNEFYLHRLFETKKYNFAGTIYLDGASVDTVEQENMILYGHNMKNGSMFGKLKRLKEQETFDAVPVIEFYLKGEVRYYLIYSVKTVSISDKAPYTISGFDKQEHIDETTAGAELFRNVNISKNGFERYGGQILTLSTCVGNAKYRLTINAVRVK